jgi:anti-anti-sigma factor
VRDQAGGCPVRWHGDQAVVTLPEQMDVSNAGQVREELLWVINRGAAALVVDMTATISCDHAGADAVARAYQRAVVSGTGMRLAVTAQIVRRVLSLSGLDRLVSIYPSLEAAMAVTAPAARTPLALVGSLAGNGAGGRQASRPPADALPGRGGPAAPPPASDTAITPALIREMVESFPDGVALADGGGVITLASRRLEDMFGYGHAELADSSIERLVPSDLQAAHRGHRAGYARAPAARPMGAGALLAGLRKDGTTFPVEISLSPLATPAAAADTAYRHGELLDTIVTRLFSAGLTLQSAASQAPGAAADAIDAAASKLEDVIRDIRDTVFTADTTEPRA